MYGNRLVSEKSRGLLLLLFTPKEATIIVSAIVTPQDYYY